MGYERDAFRASLRDVYGEVLTSGAHKDSLPGALFQALRDFNDPRNPFLKELLGEAEQVLVQPSV